MPIVRKDLPHARQNVGPIHSQANALCLLVEAYACAHDLGCDPWEFAVEIDHLHADGLTHSRLRWLRWKGYVTHRVENTSDNGQLRTFRPEANLGLQPGSCFLLTEAGLAFASAEPPYQWEHPGPNGAAAKPVWHPGLRELRLGEVLVKSFKQPAPNQELVLRAFGEEGWPPRIDDPLSPEQEQDSKRRLNNTIRNLNRSHATRLIHFEGGGDGQSVRWRLWLQEDKSDGRATVERR
jgi:hypothetical protein